MIGYSIEYGLGKTGWYRIPVGSEALTAFDVTFVNPAFDPQRPWEYGIQIDDYWFLVTGEGNWVLQQDFPNGRTYKAESLAESGVPFNMDEGERNQITYIPRTTVYDHTIAPGAQARTRLLVNGVDVYTLDLSGVPDRFDEDRDYSLISNTDRTDYENLCSVYAWMAEPGEDLP